MVKDPSIEGNDTLLNNFEILEPPKRTAKILGEEVDITIIPARIALKFISFSKKYDTQKLNLETTSGADIDEQMIEDIVEIVAMICQRSNKKITKEWLFDNLDITGLMNFIKFVFSGISKLNPEKTEASGKKGKN